MIANTLCQSLRRYCVHSKCYINACFVEWDTLMPWNWRPTFLCDFGIFPGWPPRLRRYYHSERSALDSSLGDVDSSPRPAGMLYVSLSSRFAHLWFLNQKSVHYTSLLWRGQPGLEERAARTLATMKLLNLSCKDSITTGATEVQMPQMAFYSPVLVTRAWCQEWDVSFTPAASTSVFSIVPCLGVASSHVTWNNGWQWPVQGGWKAREVDPAFPRTHVVGSAPNTGWRFRCWAPKYKEKSVHYTKSFVMLLQGYEKACKGNLWGLVGGLANQVLSKPYDFSQVALTLSWHWAKTGVTEVSWAC